MLSILRLRWRFCDKTMIYEFSAEIHLGAKDMKDARESLARHYGISVKEAKRIFNMVRKVKI